MDLSDALSRDIRRHPELGAFDVDARPGGVVAVTPYPGVATAPSLLRLLRRLGYRAWLAEDADGDWIAVVGRPGSRWLSPEEQLRDAAARIEYLMTTGAGRGEILAAERRFAELLDRLRRGELGPAPDDGQDSIGDNG